MSAAAGGPGPAGAPSSAVAVPTTTATLDRPARPRWDPRGWRWWVQVLAVYTASRLLLVLFFVKVAQVQVASGWTGAKPSYFEFVGYQFDATWYRKIAEGGYPHVLPVGTDGLVSQNPWAFFPAYPMLVRAVMTVTGGSWVVAAPLVSTVLGGVAMLLIHRVLVVGAPRAVAARPGLPVATVALLCAFPSSGVLQAGYTESLALALIAASLLLVVRRRYEWAALAVLVLGFTRAVAEPMAVVVGVHLLVRVWSARRGRESLPVRDVVRVAALGLVAVVSGLLWPAICGWVTGVSDGYLQTQEAWRAVRSVTPFYAWTYAAPFWFGHGAVPVEVGLVVAFLVLAVLPAMRRLGAELYAWGLAYPLYIAAVIEPGTSATRFALLAFPVAAAGAGVVRAPAWARRGALTLMLLGALALQYHWVATIWLFTPPADWPP